MAIRKIYQDDAPELDVVCKPVEEITSEVELHIQDLKDTARAHPTAIGIASNQIGGELRIILVRIKIGGTKRWQVMINPVLNWKAKKTVSSLEGCLSVDKTNTQYTVKRSNSVIVEFMDEKGEMKKVKLSKLDAYLVQHEIDHCNGITIADHGTAKV